MGFWGRMLNQEIPHILITPSVSGSMLCFLVLIIIFASFGAKCLVSAMANHELLVRYDDVCNGKKNCTIEFTPTHDLINPKIYYQLENFYANHRTFVKSRSYKQNRGVLMSAADIGKECNPVLTVSKLGSKIGNKSLAGTTLKNGDVAFPCGLIAKYFFNDTYVMTDMDSKVRVEIDEKNIAHKIDREEKFKLPQGVKNPLEKAWLDISNEHVMVWFQTERFRTFIKLWGHIWTTLKAGTKYSIQISNKFDVSTFDGKKYILLSEVGPLGGTSQLLGIGFLASAAVVVLMSLVFIVMYFTHVHGQDLYSLDKAVW
jgi:hypothetical protein